MRYGDLIQFEPLESVVQLRWADERGGAQRLVETFIVSKAMADQVINVVIPQLRFDQAHDSKGILLVGNYGTGKSHLLSVLSAIAEYPELANALRHPGLRSAAAHIQGRFNVLRLEIGAVSGSLRDMVLRELSDALAGWGTPFTFPSADQITNNKDSLISAMAAFQARYPGTGVLLLVDELLEHLERRQGHELILDLGFLRELGEVAALTPLRCVAGVQATLFDHPRFRFAAERVHRVRERFEQVTIARDDLECVVANRLLSKTDAQLAWITAHLRRVAPLYDDMPEHIDHFARLFPIHPDYLATFEKVRVAEKGGTRRTHQSRLHTQGTAAGSRTDYPRALRPAFDDGRRATRSSAETSSATGEWRPTFVRRLAWRGGRNVANDGPGPPGATAEEFKHGLCLFVPTPEASADFLLGQVQVALDHIMRTVSGQYNIWPYQLPWTSHHVTRPGYLCFSEPNLRPTSQPSATSTCMPVRPSMVRVKQRVGLRANLATDSAQRSSIEAMASAERGAIELFLDQADDAATLPAGFVKAARRALRGIQAVRLQGGALLEALENGGLPSTVDELKVRFATFLAASVTDQAAASMRLTFSDSSPI